MVTPELVEPMDASQVPPCGPGMQSASPSDWELFFKGHLEVPVCRRPAPPGNGLSPATPGGPRLATAGRRQGNRCRRRACPGRPQCAGPLQPLQRASTPNGAAGCTSRGGPKRSRHSSVPSGMTWETRLGAWENAVALQEYARILRRDIP